MTIIDKMNLFKSLIIGFRLDSKHIFNAFDISKNKKRYTPLANCIQLADAFCYRFDLTTEVGYYEYVRSGCKLFFLKEPHLNKFMTYDSSIHEMYELTKGVSMESVRYLQQVYLEALHEQDQDMPSIIHTSNQLKLMRIINYLESLPISIDIDLWVKAQFEVLSWTDRVTLGALEGIKAYERFIDYCKHMGIDLQGAGSEIDQYRKMEQQYIRIKKDSKKKSKEWTNAKKRLKTIRKHIQKLTT